MEFQYLNRVTWLVVCLAVAAALAGALYRAWA